MADFKNYITPRGYARLRHEQSRAAALLTDAHAPL